MTGKHLSQEYRDYMQSDAWDERRKAALRRAGYRCERCGATNKPLDVHHLNYDRFGKERPSDLEALCRKCHGREHGDTSIIFDICRTCGEFLMIFFQRMSDGWNRWTCSEGHVVEKRRKRGNK